MALNSLTSPIVLVSAAAVRRPDGHILLAQRPEGKRMAGLWELPGGKVEAGETPEAALVRELEEELGMTTETANLHPITFASHAYDDFHLLMPVFACENWRGGPDAREGQTLEWVAPEKLFDYPAPAADLPLFKFLQDWSAWRS